MTRPVLKNAVALAGLVALFVAFLVLPAFAGHTDAPDHDFPDVPNQGEPTGNMSPEHIDAVDWADHTGIFKGRTDGTFDPWSPYARVHVPLTFHRYDENVVDPKVAEASKPHKGASASPDGQVELDGLTEVGSLDLDAGDYIVNANVTLANTVDDSVVCKLVSGGEAVSVGNSKGPKTTQMSLTGAASGSVDLTCQSFRAQGSPGDTDGDYAIDVSLTAVEVDLAE